MDAKLVARRGAAAGGAVLTSALMVFGATVPAHASDCRTTTEGYSHHKVTVCGTHQHRGVTTTTDAGTLPTTGVDAGLITVVGLGLVGGGTMLVASGRKRRAARAAG